MPDIQISDPYTNEPTFYKYDSNDRKILVDLLQEYSTKLITICDNLFAAKNIQKSYFYFILLSSFLIVFYIVKTRIDEIYYGLQIDRLWLINFFLSTSTTLIIFALTIKISSLSPFFKPYARSITQKRLLERDASIIAGKLEKVIQVTIEIQDQIETNLSRKLELDLRVADAQSALDYYYSVFNSKSGK
jgi:hypothetical protein